MDFFKRSSLKCRYLQVYILVVAADWLQGPHVYALYESYGKTRDEISQLFVAGFLSSLILGTFTASFADKIGRKKICALYGVLYAVSCMTKHSCEFWILFGGRILAGIATSIMFTAFESWLVCENGKAASSQSVLTEILSTASSANGMTAIAAGLVAQTAADYFGLVSPFDIAGTISLLSCLLVILSWEENYGSERESVLHSFREGWRYLIKDPNIALTGSIQALFEGSMYIFVLQWTPALAVESDGASKTLFPHGYIFAGFMVAVAVGSRIFRYFSTKTTLERIIFATMSLATLTFIPTIVPMNPIFVFTAFLVFEICVGIFWPCIGSLKSIFIPESCRATLMNYFRIPVNIIVVIVLLQSSSNLINFILCIIFLAFAAIFGAILCKRSKKGDLQKRNTCADSSDDCINLLEKTDVI